MGWFGNRSATTFPWTKLTSSEQLDTLLAHSTETPVLLFKHSTRCSISSMALSRFENQWDVPSEVCECVFLDLLNYRSLSAEIASKTGIEHESPQVIVIKNNRVIYHASHNGINAREIITLLQQA